MLYYSGILAAKEEGRREVALKLLNEELSPAIIKNATGLSLEEIRKLK